MKEQASGSSPEEAVTSLCGRVLLLKRYAQCSVVSRLNMKLRAGSQTNSPPESRSRHRAGAQRFSSKARQDWLQWVTDRLHVVLTLSVTYGPENTQIERSTQKQQKHFVRSSYHRLPEGKDNQIQDGSHSRAKKNKRKLKKTAKPTLLVLHFWAQLCVVVAETDPQHTVRAPTHYGKSLLKTFESALFVSIISHASPDGLCWNILGNNHRIYTCLTSGVFPLKMAVKAKQHLQHTYVSNLDYLKRSWGQTCSDSSWEPNQTFPDIRLCIMSMSKAGELTLHPSVCARCEHNLKNKW